MPSRGRVTLYALAVMAAAGALFLLFTGLAWLAGAVFVVALLVLLGARWRGRSRETEVREV
ncbi:hypothetical protein FHY55_07365 [Oceanicola sp. D3]|uniref:hypothetical protein n=1 Tax=Oceanicola sp. D3 TaxID=2587163 RepID=UPI0011202B6B|nr:hypothetical protein [Oceanicola sp. D3]QDC09070.1 hypothetical protein FHY55_07365 [Oceanicola sp. D3]